MTELSVGVESLCKARWFSAHGRRMNFYGSNCTRVTGAALKIIRSYAPLSFPAGSLHAVSEIPAAVCVLHESLHSVHSLPPPLQQPPVCSGRLMSKSV